VEPAEPNSVVRRHNVVLADTAVIRALGAAHSRRGDGTQGAVVTNAFRVINDKTRITP